MNKLICSLLVSLLVVQSAYASGFLSSRVTQQSSVTYISNSADFADSLNSSEYVVAMLAAKWKGFDKARTAFADLSTQFTNLKFTYTNLDVNDCSSIEAQYGVTVYPTYLVFQNGALINQQNGGTKAQLQAMLSSEKFSIN